MNKFYQLKVSEVKQETDDAKSIAFDIPERFKDIFQYKPGQYLTLKFNLNGKEERRSYSLCSSPAADESLRVGVKRVKDGLVSNHINDKLEAGMVVEVMPPDGRFLVDVSANNNKAYYLFAAGSGITPMLSILRTVLLTEEKSTVHLVYGNRTQDSIMFKEELDELQERYPNRFNLVYTLSRSKRSLWSGKPKMDFRKGRVDAECVQWFVGKHPSGTQDAAYFICGPGTMIENTKKALMGIDIPEEQIFIESFGEEVAEDANEDAVGEAKLTAYLDDEEIHITVPEGKTILRALIDENYDPPYSCEGGVCSTCICLVKKGKVHMKTNVALTDKEVEEGYALSCQSIPLTQEVEIEYE